MRVNVKKTDEEKQLVFAEVYAPNSIDTDSEYMTAIEIEKMAHDFMRRLKGQNIDTYHDNESDGSYVVESFIAMEGQEVFIPGSWVVGVKASDESWEKIKSGEINGFSFEAMVLSEPTEIIVDFPNPLKGRTTEEISLSDGVEKHDHEFSVKYDPDTFKFLGGVTSKNEDHFHEIKKSTVTEYSNGHRHRFSFVEDLTILDIDYES